MLKMHVQAVRGDPDREIPLLPQGNFSLSRLDFGARYPLHENTPRGHALSCRETKHRTDWRGIRQFLRHHKNFGFVPGGCALMGRCNLNGIGSEEEWLWNCDQVSIRWRLRRSIEPPNKPC